MKLTSVALLVLITPAVAQQPVPKVGSCPSGYHQSGGYCAPMSANAPVAIVKTGQCPSGWMQSGAYCIQMQSRR
jgi:hypothetical protein